MKNYRFKEIFQNLKTNILFLFSTAALLCLLLSPTVQSVCVTLLLICVSIAAAALCKQIRPFIFSGTLFNCCILWSSLLLGFMMYDGFQQTWVSTGYVKTISYLMRCTPEGLIQLLGRAGFIAGFYALHIWLSLFVHFVMNINRHTVKEAAQAFLTYTSKYVNWGTWKDLKGGAHKITVPGGAAMCANLRSNWFFAVSAAAYVVLNILPPKEYLITALVSICAIVAGSALFSNIGGEVKNSKRSMKVFALLSTAGICWSGQRLFYATWTVEVKSLAYWFADDYWRNEPIQNAYAISIVCAVLAIYCVYVFVLSFWEKLCAFIKNSGLVYNVSKKEIALYMILLIIMLCVLSTTYAKTDAFFPEPEELPVDIIYIGDSSDFLVKNVFINVTHFQNDIKQPLFALFAAPFIGLPYFIARVFSVSMSVEATLITAAQVVMLFFANFFLAGIMSLTPQKRICFMLITCATYSQLLFTLMVEQYIVAYFYLILLMYMICGEKAPESFILWGAGGTILTSMALTPLVAMKNEQKTVIAWVREMIWYCISFVVLIAIFRFDTIYNLIQSIVLYYYGFANENMPFADKCLQYLSFISDCFLAPNAGINRTFREWASWQLMPVDSLDIPGLLLAVLTVVSAVLNRKKKSSQVAAYWCAFSVVLMVIVGWGTVENGLILYALYFGWAFAVLLFQLMEWIDDRLKKKFLFPVLCAVIILGLLICNVPAIMEMVRFAIEYYPV